MSSHLDVLGCLLPSVKPEAIIKPLFDELQRRLRSKDVLGRHAEVIHEGEELLTTNWHIHTYTCTHTEHAQGMCSGDSGQQVYVLRVTSLSKQKLSTSQQKLKQIMYINIVNKKKNI